MQNITEINNYESMVVLSSAYSENELKEIVYPYIEQLNKLGALSISIVKRGKRDLAYTIDKHKNGYFIQVYFTSSPSILSIYQTKLNLDKNILRSMVINVSK